MLPFTKDDVVAAFKRHPEIEPIKNRFFVLGEGANNPNEKTPILACCGLSILAIDAGHKESVLRCSGNIPFAIFRLGGAMGWEVPKEDEISYDNPFWKFISGFDSRDSNASTERLQALGPEYQAGWEAYQEVIKDRKAAKNTA